ncbi:MAG: NAD(P)H-hydrate dehydratase [Nitrosomonas sp.]|nr:NAD(P)H-hydrate dehydratase [Nitrosomonas sp.]MBP6076826.1 NAD(P)H-hydrate dehydratase [Nitrosomonas sp.]
MTNADPIFPTAEIREIERQAATLPNPPHLMEKAGLAAAQIVRDQLLQNTHSHVLILAGPGNNGGDAFVVARYLKEWGNTVTTVFTGDRNRIPPDAKQAMQAWLAIGGEISTDIPSNKDWDVVIDGLFGIGLDQSKNRPITGKHLEWIHTVNQLRVPIVSLDIPSGLGSDNGCIYGAAIRATITVTFIGLKPGLFTNFGPECCGTVMLCDLDIRADSPPPAHNTWLINKQLVQSVLPLPRLANSHKGTFGSLAILGGSTGMVGATLLAGRAALHLGAGRIYLGLLTRIAPPVDFLQPELMLRSPPELFKLKSLDCLVVGPGLGSEPEALSWLDCALSTELTLVLDADALNLIAIHPHLARKLSQREIPSILTPHPAEAARLLKTDTAVIQNDRMDAVYRISQQFNCYAVLKGAGSICCFPDGKRYLNTSGNPGLSSAGTGDVLAGMIGALIAQDLSLDHALLLAVYLHGAAADHLLQQNHGPLGMTASEIITAARSLLNHWIYKACC